MPKSFLQSLREFWKMVWNGEEVIIPTRTSGTYNGGTAYNIEVDASPTVRQKQIELQAYYLAEADGFKEDPTFYWLKAEKQVNSIIKIWECIVSGKFNPHTYGSGLCWPENYQRSL